MWGSSKLSANRISRGRRRPGGRSSTLPRAPRRPRSRGGRSKASRPPIGVGAPPPRRGPPGKVVLARVLLIGLFVFFLARALWRLLDGVVSGGPRFPTAPPAPRPGRQGRGPGGGAQIQYFCSEQCRTAYPRRSQDDHAVKS